MADSICFPRFSAWTFGRYFSRGLEKTTYLHLQMTISLLSGRKNWIQPQSDWFTKVELSSNLNWFRLRSIPRSTTLHDYSNRQTIPWQPRNHEQIQNRSFFLMEEFSNQWNVQQSNIISIIYIFGSNSFHLRWKIDLSMKRVLHLRETTIRRWYLAMNDTLDPWYVRWSILTLM